MQLVEIKICVMTGLLVTTFGAACLPLLIMWRYVRSTQGDVKTSRLAKFLQRLQHIAESCCFSRCGKTVNQQTDEDGTSTTMEDTDEKPKKNSQFLSLMNCFSGGVFLGTSFLALMPEIREIFDKVGIMWPKFYG